MSPSPCASNSTNSSNNTINSNINSNSNSNSNTATLSSIPAPSTSNNINLNYDVDVNINNAVNPKLPVIPTSAALSTAAAVAAMSSCFTTPHTLAQPGVTNLTNGVINGSSGAPSPSDIDVSFTVPSMLSVLPLVSALPSSTNINGTAVAVAPAPYLHQQQQQQLHVSANTSASNTPCPTPGILNTTNLSPSSRQRHQQQQQQQQRSNIPSTAIPGAAMFTQTSSNAPLPTPLGRPPALPQHQRTHTQARTSSSMLPHNQLVYGTNAPVPSAAPINVNMALTGGNTVPAPTTSTAPTIHHNPITRTQPPNQQQQQLTTQPQQQIQRLSHPGAIPLPAPSTFHHLQQHPLNAAAASFRPRPVQISKPNIFANMALRRGKWTSEEERFANALIEEFEKGTILDCENGCTLRAYLSRKLHCAPMRISKKYAGKSIGKHVFLSRIPALLNRNGLTIGVNGVGRVGVGTTMGVGVNGNTTTNLNNNSVRSTQENLDKIRDLEFHFHMSLLQEGAACAIGHNIGKRLTSGVVGGSSSMNVVGSMGNMGRVQGGHASVLPRTLVTAGGVSGAPTTSAYPMIFPSPHANFSRSNPVTTVAAPTSYLNQVSSSNVNAKTPAVPAAPFHWFTPGPITTNPNLTLPSPATDLQMQDSLFNAFKEAQTSSNLPPASTLSSTVSTGQHQQHQEISNLLQPNFSNVPTSSGNGNDGAPLPNSVQGLTVDASPQPSLENAHGLFSNNNIIKDNNGISQQSQQQNSAISTSQAQQNWLSETMHIIPTLDPSSYMGQFSPTYTSQSFDDLHQFIGKDCPPSDSTTTEMKGPATEAANKLHQLTQGLVTGNISAADSYALFAQQSAMAVSKHSAYAIPNHHPNHNHQQVNRNVSSIPVSNICNNEIYSASVHTHTITKPTGSLISSGAVNVAPAISTSAQITRPAPIQQAITVMSSPVKQIQNTRNNSTNNAGVKMENVASSSTATFNAVNLQLHSAAVKLREMVDDAESDTVSSSSGDIVPTTTASSAKYSSSSRIRHTNLVSGSDRSSSDNGNESMSAGGSGSSGSDNSDAASDEGQSSSNSTSKSKRRIDINEGNQEKKRQKTSLSTKKETIQ